MNLKSVHTKPAPKAMSKNIRLNHKIGDAASNEAKQLAYQYINEWCHNWAIRHSKLQNLDDIQIERVEDFIYWHLTRPRQDSVKNQKTGRVGQSYLDSFMDLITENNTNADTTWQQKLRAYISKFCNSCSKQVWNEALGASFNAEGSYDEYGSNATEGDMDIESSAAFEDKSGNFGDYETYGESEEENAPGADHSDRDFIEGFKRMSPEMQAALIKELGTGKNFTDPRMKRLYQQMRKYVKKGVDIEDSADIPAAIPANITRLAADLILWAIDNLDPDEQLYEWHYSKDRWDALKKWAETLYNNTEEIDESFDDGYDSEEVTDSAPSDAEVDALLKALNTDGANVTKEQLMKAYASLKKDAQVADSKIVDEDAGPKQGLTPDQWPTEVEDPNTGEMKPVGDIKKADSKKLKKNDLVTIIGAKRVKSKVKDSRTTPYNMVIAQLRNIPVGKTGNLNFETGNYDFQFDVTARDGKSYDICMSSPEVGNCQSVAEGNAFQMIKSLADAYIKKNSPASYSDIKDSARQFKVYYLDENRKTRTLFVEAYDEDDALEVAAEKIPARCEVHSAVDTNPLG